LFPPLRFSKQQNSGETVEARLRTEWPVVNAATADYWPVSASRHWSSVPCPSPLPTSWPPMHLIESN